MSDEATESENQGAGGNGPTEVPEESPASESDLALDKYAAEREGTKDTK